MQMLGNFGVRLQGVGVKEFNNDIKRTNGLLGTLGMNQKGVGGLAKRFIGLGAAVMIGINQLKQLSQWIQTSIQDFRDFELRMAEVSTILTGVSNDQLPKLEAGVVALSTTWGKNARDLANGLYDILSAAVAAEDSIRLLNTATKASIAGLTEVSVSVDVFTSVLNAYGKEVSQAAYISDVLFQTVIRGKLRFEDLASALGYVTPIAANAGVAFEEIAAILATVTRQGLHVDMASRGLALMIQGIVSPATAAAEAARQYGIDMSGLVLQVKGLKGFMEDLNTAVSEHGSVILPQVIRNMRSLRIAMALAGEEGVKGFAEDLTLMQTAYGKTEEAMTKMMNTQERQVAILANTMEAMERTIGESFSGFDIQIKRIKLWWAALAAGEDANATLKTIDDNTRAMKRSYVDLYLTQQKMQGRKTLWQELLGEGRVTPQSLMSKIDFSSIKKYLDLNKEAQTIATATHNLEMMKLAIESLEPPANNMGALEAMTRGQTGLMINTMNTMADPSKWANLLNPFEMLMEGATRFAPEVEVSSEQLDYLNNTLEKLGLETVAVGTTWSQLGTILKNTGQEISNNENTLAALTETINNLQPAQDYFEAAFEDATDAIQKMEENILSLQAEMKTLRVEVEDTYTALTGESFNGKLEWEIAVKVDETKLDRFQQFSDMAGKYGMPYMDKYIAQYGSLDKEMSNALATIYEYNKAVKAQEEAEAELQKVLDENLLLIRKNNLEKMKLQLAGMMRRRGNTRAEQQMMKKIDMENLRLRIENMQKEVEAEEASAKTSVDALEERYKVAKSYLEKYLDEERHSLWLLKDIRDDEIADMEEDLDYKRGLLKKYTQWYNEELVNLETANDIYLQLLQSYAQLFPEAYAEMFDTSYIDNWISKYNEFKEMSGIGGTVGNTVESLKTSGGVPAPIANIVAGKRSGEIIARALTRINMSGGAYGNDPNVITPHATGIPFVPAEGLYHLHRGETVVPANQSGGENITVNNYINGNQISNTNLQDVAQQIGRATAQALIDRKTGKSKYRMR